MKIRLAHSSGQKIDLSPGKYVASVIEWRGIGYSPHRHVFHIILKAPKSVAIEITVFSQDLEKFILRMNQGTILDETIITIQGHGGIPCARIHSPEN